MKQRIWSTVTSECGNLVFYQETYNVWPGRDTAFSWSWIIMKQTTDLEYCDFNGHTEPWWIWTKICPQSLTVNERKYEWTVRCKYSSQPALGAHKGMTVQQRRLLPKMSWQDGKGLDLDSFKDYNDKSFTVMNHKLQKLWGPVTVLSNFSY